MDRLNDTEKVQWGVVGLRITICSVGIIGNFLAIFVIVVLKEYRKVVTNWYVLQLAIADSIFLCTLPFKMVEDIKHEWIYSSGMCKAKETVLFLNYYASILFLMIMSIDRYVAVCHGFSDFVQKFRTHTAAYFITASTWIVALLLCIPVMMYSDKIGIAPYCTCSYDFPRADSNDTRLHFGSKCIDFDSFQLEEYDPEYYIGDYGEYENAKVDSETDAYNYGYGDYNSEAMNKSDTFYNMEATKHSLTNEIVININCHYWDQGKMWKFFLCFNFIVMFIIPFLVMAFCYVSLVLKLREIKTKQAPELLEPMNPSTSSNSNQDQKLTKSASAKMKSDAERIRLTMTCAAMVVCFFVCWLPFHAVHIAKIRGIIVSSEHQNLCHILPLVGTFLAYSNSAINPYLYNCIGTRFIHRFRKASSALTTTLRFSLARVSSQTSSHSRTGITKVASTHV